MSISCSKDGALYACALPSGNPVAVPVTFDQILNGVTAAGGTISVSDPAMWITGWGGAGSNGTECCGGGGEPHGGGGASGGVAQVVVSPQTYEAVYGTSSLYYSVGKGGQPGPGDNSYGGWGGGATVVSASPPPVSSPGQAPPFWEVVLVAGGGGGGGGGGSYYDGRTGGQGGTAISTFLADARAAGAKGSDGSGGNGYGGNEDGEGGGGQGGCGSSWCQGADGVGGFGGFGSPGATESSTYLFSSEITPGFNIDSGQWLQAAVQSPGMGGGSADLNDSNTGYTPCGSNGVVCGGGGGAGFGGGGAGDWKDDPDGGLAGGGGGSYAAQGTCDAQGAPSASLGRDSILMVYVDPAQDCSSSLAALRTRKVDVGGGPTATSALGPALAEVVSPENGTIGPQAAQQVVVRPAPGAVITQARLNGRDVTSRLSRASDGSWRGTLTPSEGVTVGENTLVVTAERGSDQWYATAHFVRTSPKSAQLVSTDLKQGESVLQELVQHLGNEPVLTTFTLNGQDVPSGHLERRLGLETLRLSASSGLQQGTNRLEMAAYTRAGAFQRVIQTVRIPNGDPVAGAGPDRRLHVDGRAVLDGSSSLPPKGGRDSSLGFRWRIALAPAGSRAKLAGVEGKRAQFRPDLPGRYLVVLTVTAPDGRSSSDTATVTADALPNTRIDTLAASGGSPGVELDSAWFCPDSGTDTSCLFQANPAGDDAHVQLLVLDRDTLAVESNTSYSPSDLVGLNKAISELVVTDGTQQVPDTSKLVVITLGTGAVTDVSDFSAAVSQIGMPAYDSSVTSVPGPFSIIGIPGMNTGKAWHNFGLQIGGNPAGALVGYIKDSAYYDDGGVLQAEQRVFTFPDVVRFETRVVDGTNIQVQLQLYDAAIRSYSTTTLATFSTTGGGLGIVTFDPYTLAMVEAKKWTPDTPAIDWVSVHDQLQAAIAAGDGVAIVSLGQMSGYTSEPTASTFQQEVLPEIRQLGGQPDIFARAVNDNGTYSFIGVGGQGAESSSAVAAGVPSRSGPDGTTPLPVTTGDLTGELRRGSDGRFVPSQADPSGIYQSEIDPVIYEAPTDWPDTPAAGDTTADGAEAALAWLAQCKVLPGNATVVPGLALWQGQDCSTDGSTQVSGTPDPAAVREVALSLRADYYDNANLTLDDVSSLSYATLFPQGNSIFTESDFQAAQTQLGKERNDLAAVKTFFGNMGSVISSSQASLTEAMTQIATTVQQAYFSQQQTITVTDYTGWAESLFGGFKTAASTIASLFTADELSIGQLFQTAGLLSDVGSTYQTLINGPQTSAFTDIEAWLQLDQQLQNTSASVDEAVLNSISLQQLGFGMTQDAVMSDWGRLDTVAANSQGSWSISSDELSQAANAFVISTRQLIWQGYAHQLWTAGYADTAAMSATRWGCTLGSTTNTTFPFLRDVQSGLPTGLGQGVQYWPVQTISSLNSEDGRNYPSWLPYIMWEQGTNGTAPPLDAVTAIFQQPDVSASSAGAFGPWFWPTVFDMTRELGGCTSSGEPQTKDGNFYGQTG